MPQWAAFVGLTGVVCTVLLALARLSQTFVSDGHGGHPGERTWAEGGDGRHDADELATGRSSRRDELERFDDHDVGDGDGDGEGKGFDDPPRAGRDRPSAPGDRDGPEADGGPAAVGGHEPGMAAPQGAKRGTGSLSTGALLANVALTQGVFGGVLVAGAWYTEIPPEALGLGPDALGLPALLAGVALGVALWLANEVGAGAADAAGIERSEELRETLAPDTGGGWLLLLAVVLPLIAGVEEFIFRAALVGAPAAGFGASPWLLAVVSSGAFALGHGAQGRVGVVVTGGLGFVLAGAFVLTNSLAVVLVAHYLVNALEFVVHEGLGVDPF